MALSAGGAGLTGFRLCICELSEKIVEKFKASKQNLLLKIKVRGRETVERARGRKK